MATSTPAKAAEQGEFPVRLVDIFGKQIVVPRDVACEVSLGFDPAVNVYGFGEKAEMDAVLRVTISIFLYHGHFPGNVKEFHFLLFQEKSSNTAWVKKRTRVQTRTIGSRVFQESAKRTILKSFNGGRLKTAVLQMFLGGDINMKGLEDCLPKKKCLG